MSEDNPNIAAFRTQAWSCRALGSELTAIVLEAAIDTLDRTTQTGRAILDWTNNPLADALPLRLAGALHALARRGDAPGLAALYRDGTGDAESAVAEALATHDNWLLGWLESPPQTNEVGRAGALMAGLMVAAAKLHMPFELLEIGSSAGLNLNLDRFRYRLGEVAAGPESSGVEIAPRWTGASPPAAWPEIAARAGVDRNPLDSADDAVAERLIAYVWPDQAERLARIEAAIALARSFPPPVAQGDAAAWLTKRLEEPQADGVARIVMHSVVWQYLTRAQRDGIFGTIRDAAASATENRPLGWLKFEPSDNLAVMQLKLRLWPSGDDLHLATCHPHGATVDWLVPVAGVTSRP